MAGDILGGISVGLKSLSAGAGILALLGILCIWVWTLIILTAVALRDAAKQSRGMESSPDAGSGADAGTAPAFCSMNRASGNVVDTASHSVSGGLSDPATPSAGRKPLSERTLPEHTADTGVSVQVGNRLPPIVAADASDSMLRAEGAASCGVQGSRPERGTDGGADTSTGRGVVEQHRLFCRVLDQSGISGRLRKRIVRAHMDIAMRQFSKNVGTILLLASLAPLLGLLGTVEGMIGTFRALAEAGNASNAALTEGISKALVTTQGGLLVAIPSLLAGGVLYRKTRKLRNTLRSISLRSENSGAMFNSNGPCPDGGA
ncbi:MotA/TolQ/ExbB proton channel family protein [Oleidesulfovibrio sp.]|uniref:MotA/TolQ/ExbB proton channel family protein n=1 Tax=Oleidesulfovibrio sp. TaxID=2909707 RepID=UPI003A83677F